MSEEPKGNRGLRFLLVSLVVLVALFVVLVSVAYRAPSPGVEVGLDRLYGLAGQGRVISAQLLDEDAVLVGRVCSAPTLPPAVAGAPRVCRGQASGFHSAYPRGGEVLLIQSHTSGV